MRTWNGGFRQLPTNSCSLRKGMRSSVAIQRYAEVEAEEEDDGRDANRNRIVLAGSMSVAERERKFRLNWSRPSPIWFGPSDPLFCRWVQSLWPFGSWPLSSILFASLSVYTLPLSHTSVVVGDVHRPYRIYRRGINRDKLKDNRQGWPRFSFLGDKDVRLSVARPRLPIPLASLPIENRSSSMSHDFLWFIPVIACSSRLPSAFRLNFGFLCGVLLGNKALYFRFLYPKVGSFWCRIFFLVTSLIAVTIWAGEDFKISLGWSGFERFRFSCGLGRGENSYETFLECPFLRFLICGEKDMSLSGKIRKVCNRNRPSAVVEPVKGVNRREEAEAEKESLLPAEESGGVATGRRKKGSARNVQWNDCKGDNLVEVLEFQPRSIPNPCTRHSYFSKAYLIFLSDFFPYMVEIDKLAISVRGNLPNCCHASHLWLLHTWSTDLYNCFGGITVLFCSLFYITDLCRWLIFVLCSWFTFLFHNLVP